MDNIFCMLLLLSYVICTSLPGVGSVTAAEMKTHLTNTFNGYNTDVRPVTDQSDVLKVSVDLYLISINNFDNKNQKLATTAYLNVQWTDQVLAAAWSNTNVASVLVPQANVWLPDLALQNGFESLTGLGSTFLYVDVLKDGAATWRPYKVFESSCEVDVTFFPFDSTTCDLKFVIWSNTITKARVAAGSVGISLDNYDTNSEWSIASATSANAETTTSSGVTFSIQMKRKPLFYLLNIILPVIMLVVLNTFVFVLPASDGEKAGFAITIFLAFAVFLTIISAELPQNSEKVSIFAVYLALMTFMSTGVVVATLFQLRFFNRSDKLPIPDCLVGMIRCVNSCCSNRGATGKGQGLEHHSYVEVTWSDASNAIDFTLFFVFFIFTVVATVLTFVFAVNGADSGYTPS